MHDQLLKSIFAHTRVRESNNDIEFESLEEHLQLTEKYARLFAASFSSSECAALAARFHDLGKASLEFQNYLLASSELAICEEDPNENTPKTNIAHGPDHSSAGAQFIAQKIQGIGLLLAYAIAGHHSGLPDGFSSTHKSLEFRLRKQIPDWRDNANTHLPSILQNVNYQALIPEIGKFLGDGYSCSFWIRMIFSCLVDADFLATEKYMSEGHAMLRENNSQYNLPQLLEKLNVFLQELDKKIETKGLKSTHVNQVRSEVRSDCLEAATLPPGLFSLTVPTGGGKTLSSITFALNHAIRHGLKRIIYVIPYVSIIEQNAEVFRKVFGNEAILEHHCNADDHENATAKMIAENWDAPIIVTTAVQFYESLHASRSSRCRKLHNIAKSVVILDEAQCIPTEYLRPCLRALNELTINYGTSVVLCTATQPAVLDQQIREGGLTGNDFGCREIIHRDRNLFQRMQRVCVSRIPGRISDDDLAPKIVSQTSCLVIVSSRSHAKNLYKKIVEITKDTAKYCVRHLSAQMCPVHRQAVLEEVKKCLNDHLPVILVSTQLIEAGVDIDFPCVFREIAGVDAMSQAAGRCNREGKLPQLGQVFLFESSDFASPPGFLREAAQIGKSTIDLPEFSNSELSPESVLHYFQELYEDVRKSDSVHGLDKIGVLSEMLPVSRPKTKDDFFSIKFATLGEKFHLIDDVTLTIFIPWGEGNELCEQLRHSYSPQEQHLLARKLQSYAVNIFGSEPRDKEGHLIAELVHDTFWILTSPELNYSDEWGLSLQTVNNPELFQL